MSTLWKLIVSGATVYAGLSVCMFLLQHRLVYFPRAELYATPQAIGLGYEDIRIETTEGSALHAWYVPYDPQALTVLFMHGNAGNISDRLQTLKLLHELKLNTLIFDYSGYGMSEGKPSEQATYDDAMSAWRYLTEQRGTAPATIVVFGRSLGGGPAAWLATQVKPAGLILESSFTSVPDRAAEIYPWLPVRLLARIHYNTNQRLMEIDHPILIVHSREDEVVPFSHGQRNFQTARQPKSFLQTSGGHNDGFLIGGSDYQSGLARFLKPLRGLL